VVVVRVDRGYVDGVDEERGWQIYSQTDMLVVEWREDRSRR
jgi:hypothetical protein